MKSRIGLLLFLSALGVPQIFAVDIQGGAGLSWGEAVSGDKSYAGFSGFLGVEKALTDFLSLGGEYEFVWGSREPWPPLADSLELPPRYILQHTPKVYLKLQTRTFLSLAGMGGVGVALPYDGSDSWGEAVAAPFFGLRFQAWFFYGQVDFFLFEEEGFTSRVSLGLMFS